MGVSMALIRCVFMGTTTKVHPKSIKTNMHSASRIYTSNTSFSTSESDSGLFEVVNDGTVGSDNPYWRDQIRNVQSATTGFSGTRWRVQSTPFKVKRFGRNDLNMPDGHPLAYISYKHDTVSGTRRGSLPPTSAATGSSKAHNQAVAKIYGQLIKFQTQLQAGEDLGEISQTLRLLKDPFSRGRKLITDVLSGHERALGLSNPRRIAQALGDTVLQYRFGVLPLTSTISSAIVGLQNRDYLGHYYPFGGTGKDEGAPSEFDTSFGTAAGTIYSFRRNLSTQSVRFEGVWGVAASVNRKSVSDVLGLKLRDVVPTIWNLIPYSWLADYFSNIGDIAEGLSVPWGGVRWCNKTVKAVNTAQDYQYRHINDLLRTWDYSFSPGSHIVECTSFVRSKVIQMPWPDLQFNANLSRGKWENIGALALSKIPLLGKLTERVLQKHKGLPSAFADEVGRRGLRVPYPFH